MRTHHRTRGVLLAAGLAVLVVTLAGCAAGADTVPAGSHPAGFWLGLWQGFIAPIALVVSFFRHDVGVYEVHNTGALYDLGFMIGISMFFSGSAGSRSAGRRRGARQDA